MRTIQADDSVKFTVRPVICGADAACVSEIEPRGKRGAARRSRAAVGPDARWSECATCDGSLIFKQINGSQMRWQRRERAKCENPVQQPPENSRQ
jgi:hypothetical protein